MVNAALLALQNTFVDLDINIADWQLPPEPLCTVTMHSGEPSSSEIFNMSSNLRGLPGEKVEGIIPGTTKLASQSKRNFLTRLPFPQRNALRSPFPCPLKSPSLGVSDQLNAPETQCLGGNISLLSRRRRQTPDCPNQLRSI